MWALSSPLETLCSHSLRLMLSAPSIGTGLKLNNRSRAALESRLAFIPDF